MNLDMINIGVLLTENIDKLGKMIWNGNELVFENEPNVGIGGIANGVPDFVGEEIARRWNYNPPAEDN